MRLLRQERVQQIRSSYEACFANDLRHHGPAKFACAPIESYRSFYAPLEELGLELVAPEDVGYKRGRTRECAQFVLDMIGLPLDVDTFNIMVSDFPEVQEPTENHVVLYHWATIAQPKTKPSHMGVFRKGRVFSKFGDGPIFLHNFDDVPYTSLMWSRQEPSDYLTFHRTPFL